MKAVRTNVRHLPKQNADSALIALAKSCDAAGMRRDKAADKIEVAERGERKIEPPKAALRTESDAKMHLFAGGGVGYPYEKAEIDALRVLCRRAARADASWQPKESLAYFRGCEILDSWATWREEVEAEQTRSGLIEANKAFDDAGDEFDALVAQLVDMPASAIDGVLAKATAIRYLFPEEAGISNQLREDMHRYGPDESSLALSLVRDLLHLVGKEHANV